MIRLDRLSAKQLFIGLVIMQIFIWTLVPTLTHTSLPLDVVREGLAWGHEWQWGYHKHPPLPSWLVEISFLLLGDVGPFLLSQLAIVTTFIFIFLLGREIFSEKEALIAVLLLVGVYYFSLPTAEFNHNIAQMPVWAAMIYFYYKALKSGQLRWWCLLGVSAGVGLLSKYTVLVLVCVMFFYALFSPTNRKIFGRLGPYLSLLVALLIVAPHLYWLVANDYLPLRYLSDRSGLIDSVWMRPLKSIDFLLAQVASHIPIILLLLAGGMFKHIWRMPGEQKIPVAVSDRNYLLALGLAPALIVSVIPLMGGSGLRSMWGAPMWSLSGLLLVMFLGTPSNSAKTNRFYWVALSLLVFFPIAYGLNSMLSGTYSKKPKRTAWPDREIAERMVNNWNSVADCGLNIVTSDGWLGGLIAIRAEDRPSVFLEGDFSIAPWITPERLNKEGSLIVWPSFKTGSAPDKYAKIPGYSYGGVETFRWTKSTGKAAPIVLEWGFVRGQCEKHADTQ
ncbi:glycosyltransferase family 39 protein [Sedimenticola selenatireducens]|uniref:Glycosyltransferase family 39 protein n=1 Tax=Sedimenticola selenatireducens TaxID=191960 RepID=A0A557S4R7_9GAMM|nr:glycosyltransferase family 39 protein [Sedimenticola selenatireducens]TVO72410.1 glycosyltransferase family 39 protein [Sedimenticola selenatireducens]TVT64665.1 MAG: glycosyltransferase family 39 protein [Sedimenticola selenatireducens]